jgi:hypothetical protein
MCSYFHAHFCGGRCYREYRRFAKKVLDHFLVLQISRRFFYQAASQDNPALNFYYVWSRFFNQFRAEIYGPNFKKFQLQVTKN